MPKRENPTAPFRRRLQQCRKSMASSRLGALLVTNRPDYYYLTGFTGEDSAVLVTPSSVRVITDGRFATSIKQEAPWASITLRQGQLLDEVVSVVRGSRLKSVAVQSAHAPISMHTALKRKLRGVKVIDAPNLVGDMRGQKDGDELERMRRAIRIAEQAFAATLAHIRLGQTELELAARLEYEMKMRGSSTQAFDSIVAIDANAALPHAFPGTRKVKRGCTVLFDWGATWRFYRSDLTRTVFIASIPPKMRRVYEVVLEAQRRSIAAVKPGARMCDVDAVARRFIADAGFERNFNHGLGHGLGLDVHESPSLSWRSSEKLQSGMVVTVEPGVYLPGIAGVRIEDDVLVTPTGRRVLSRLPKDLDSALIPARR